MAEGIDDVLLEMALAIHAMGEAIAALQQRQARARTDAEKRDILLALPLLKTDQRDAEARMAALAANRSNFRPPDEGVLEALHLATEKLGSESGSARSAAAVANAATALLVAMRSLSAGNAGAS